ncbi:penicillin-binding protein activator [Acinetobacter sp. CFCC 10889]|uniref:penicillin-binding protein activator n=1 Tax=Acinetobacter sp. CFCC 10889 TaxID=1775557 RepID=UPI000DD08116|nr:penicillin-binding protein activator [Acinetobacter sp. CFCC 10889]
MIKNKKVNYRQTILGFGLLSMVWTAHADVLVILPETGPLARASSSIKLGISTAYQAMGAKTVLKFVNTDQKTMSAVLKQNVNKQTQMIIGPLARQDVEEIIKLAPKVPVLALNEVAIKHPNVMQFSLSKNDDAAALIDAMQNDQVAKLYIFQQAETAQENKAFFNAVSEQFKGQIELVNNVPAKMVKSEGLLLLGNYAWIRQIKKLPVRNLYMQALAVEDSQPLPKGIKFCDVPSLYIADWKDVLIAYQQNPTPMAYQRLYAFGGDAWQITQSYLEKSKQTTIDFNGRTGKIHIENNRVDRQPICFVSNGKGLAVT